MKTIWIEWKFGMTRFDCKCNYYPQVMQSNTLVKGVNGLPLMSIMKNTTRQTSVDRKYDDVAWPWDLSMMNVFEASRQGIRSTCKISQQSCHCSCLDASPNHHSFVTVEFRSFACPSDILSFCDAEYM